MRAAVGSPVARFLAAAVLVPVGTLLATPGGASADGAFTCEYTETSWGTGFSADLAVTNHGPAVDDWTVRWTFPAATAVTGVWQARIFQPDPLRATADSMPWNRTIRTGQRTTFGWSATSTVSVIPTDITVNGEPCPTSAL
jgi:hypothetical protein